MKIQYLRYPLNNKVMFRGDAQRLVPARSGCYALTTVEEEILYIGLSIDMNRRMGEHLDDPEKNCDTPMGRAVFFRFSCFAEGEIERIEQELLADCIAHEGFEPWFNVQAPN